MPESWWQYYKRVRRQINEDDAKWARDNLMITCGIGLLVSLGVYARNRTLDLDTLSVSCLVFGTCLFAFIVAAFARAPWKLDQERATEEKQLRAERDKLASDLKQIEDAKPRIVLREPNAVHVEQIGMGSHVSGVPHPEKTVPFIKVRFVNNPKGNYPNSVALRVSARIKISDVSGRCQIDMAGRWDDTTQASFIPFGFSRTDLQFVDFGIGQEHGLDVAFRDEDGTFIAWNNDNYNYEEARKPEHVLIGREFKAEVQLSAVWVNETFTFRFGSGGGSHGIVITTSL